MSDRDAWNYRQTPTTETEREAQLWHDGFNTGWRWFGETHDRAVVRPWWQRLFAWVLR